MTDNKTSIMLRGKKYKQYIINDFANIFKSNCKGLVNQLPVDILYKLYPEEMKKDDW